MKKALFVAMALLVACTASMAQSTEESTTKVDQYDRSSITTLMVYHPEDEFCCEIAKVFATMPVPEKFNEHHVGIQRFLDFNTFYGLKTKNETYAWRSQNPEQIKINQAMYEELIKQGYMLQTTIFEEYLKEEYCKRFKINYIPGKTTWDEIYMVYNTLSQKKQKTITQKVYDKVPQGLNKAKYGSVLNAKEVEVNGIAIEKLLNNNNYGQKLVARWFGLSGNTIEDATFNSNLIIDRGRYNATDIDVALAQQSAREVNDILGDAGEELIQNTYIIVNDITYVTTEEKAEVGKVVGGVLAGLLGGIMDVASADKKGNIRTNYAEQMVNAVVDIADSFTGFDVRTHSYLYRLIWDDEVAGKFYSMYYTSTPDPEKILAFLNDTSTFKVEYVAHEYEADKKSINKEGVDRSEYIKYICTRSLDKNIASLQKSYEDFKVKTPIYEVLENDKGKEIYTAKIGLKEGIDEKSTFEVVKKVVNPNTNRTKYIHVATLKPIRGKVWDNRYYMAGDRPKQDIEVTHFRKTEGGKILPGMLIIEGKYKKAKVENNNQN